MSRLFRGARGGSSEPPVEQGTGDIESGVTVEKIRDKSLFLGPMKVLDPMRTDAVKALQVRQKRLERLAALNVPEIHYIGQILSGRKIVQDSSEGIICRWMRICMYFNASFPSTITLFIFGSQVARRARKMLGASGRRHTGSDTSGLL